MIDPSEFITCDFYENLVAKANSDKFIHVHTSRVAELPASDKNITVISSNSDFGVCHQINNHPNRDLVKLASYVKWSHPEITTGRYRYLTFGPACDTERCKCSDTFSVKTDTHTASTFSQIPDNIRWFCVNLAIQHPQANWIPFGINGDIRNANILSNYQRRKKRVCYI